MFGNKPRVSIARMMVIVSVLAAECGYLRFVSDTTMDYAIIFLPTLNIMLLGLPRLRRGHEARPFWVGLEVIAMSLIGLMGLDFYFGLDFI